MCMNNSSPKKQAGGSTDTSASPLAVPPDPSVLGTGSAGKAGQAIKDRKRQNALALEAAG